MTAIHTTLTTSGNSVAVRLPKELLKISGLGNRVTIEAKQGKIIIRQVSHPRYGWSDEINALMAENGDPTHEFSDMNIISQTQFQGIPWDAVTYKDWQKNHDNLS